MKEKKIQLVGVYRSNVCVCVKCMHGVFLCVCVCKMYAWRLSMCVCVCVFVMWMCKPSSSTTISRRVDRLTGKIEIEGQRERYEMQLYLFISLSLSLISGYVCPCHVEPKYLLKILKHEFFFFLN